MVWRCTVLAVSFLFSGGSAAVSEVEKYHLQRAISEIEVVKQVVVEAQRNASEGDSKNFEYNALMWDLNEMASAIRRHITKPSTTPREIDELYLEYSNE